MITPNQLRAAAMRLFENPHIQVYAAFEIGYGVKSELQELSALFREFKFWEDLESKARGITPSIYDRPMMLLCLAEYLES